MTDINFELFDADNHYYEDEASFTRHLPKAYSERAVQWATIDGQRRMLVAGKLLNFVPNDTFDVVARPGVLDNWFRGINPEGKAMLDYYNDMEECRAAYREPDARLRLMDEQHIGKTLLFPSMGCGMEFALKEDPEALTATFGAFNRWLLEEWRFNYDERIHTAPAITLTDVDWAVQEANWAARHGARVIYLSPGPVLTASGWCSPAAAPFYPFWAAVEDLGLRVAFHQSYTLYQEQADMWISSHSAGGLAFGSSPMRGYMHDRAADGAISDTLASMICEGLFARYPGLKVLSIENGADWVPLCLQRLNKAFGQMPGSFAEPPTETFRRHIWVAPYQEDDIAQLRELIGCEQILFGSDFPHPEGLAQPARFQSELQGLTAAEQHRILRDNALALFN
ncbi:amidohydrolase family protein [Parahaliea mediterranea]|uniref:Amidohydrolase family protein n=1 Tax=Parahaliea mediterranea TaxID=651086 RepID=A0A939IIU1_9GAMM|nr:amidohydrolase family protein [Parahaliea mediterranea]MBN7795601.1 amidohydrolase family protein [Parahaliea mediterranea]